jgi:hypothetical protein
MYEDGHRRYGKHLQKGEDSVAQVLGLEALGVVRAPDPDPPNCYEEQGEAEHALERDMPG